MKTFSYIVLATQAVNAGVWDQLWTSCVKVVGEGACKRLASVFLETYYPELLQDEQPGTEGNQPDPTPRDSPQPSTEPEPNAPAKPVAGVQEPSNGTPEDPAPASPSPAEQEPQEPTPDPESAVAGPPGTGNPKDTEYEYLSEAQSGKTTRYWDCCKPSCAWPGKAKLVSNLKTCDSKHNKLTDLLVKSGCNDDGDAYTCADQSPFMMGDVAYGFAAVSLAGEVESDWCCSCYELIFADKAVKGKKMIVQVTNTGGLEDHHFDIMMPGGGMGDFIKGCAKQGEEQMGTVGKRYGGLETPEQCGVIKNRDLKMACLWRFGKWFQNADNPRMNYRKITCPKALTDVSGCVRA